MSKRNKWILGILILIIVIVGGTFGYNRYKENRPVGVYKLENHDLNKHKNRLPKNYSFLNNIYIELEKDHKARMIMYPSTYKGQSIPGFVGSGNWKLKGNKVSVNLSFSKSLGMDSISESYNIEKDGTLEGIKTKDFLSKNGEISENKFDKDYQKYNKKLKELLKENGDSNQNTGSEQNNDESSANEESNSNESSDNDSSSTSADPDEIGRAVYARVFPSEQVDYVEQDGDSYYVSNEYHSADSTVEFQINGDKVTYWTQADGDTTADGKNNAHTVSIKDLLGN